MHVHLGWVGSATPPHMFAAFEAAQRAAPQCNVILHQGEDIVPAAWRDRMDAVNMRPHMRSDVQRHCILKQYGGLWVDDDVTILRDPAEWAPKWTKYTVIRMFDRIPMNGSDMIYVPADWPGWGAVDAYIQNILNLMPGDYGIFALAGTMTRKLQDEHPDWFQALNPGRQFPFDPRTFSRDALVARGFEAASPPSLAQKAINFASSAAKHLAAGLPMCSQEEIDRRYAICQGCEFHKDGACLKCGCPLVREKKFISKLSWANESCPVGRWGPVGQ